MPGIFVGASSINSLRSLNWTPPIVLVAPSDLEAVVTSDTEITLNWTNNNVSDDGVSIERTTVTGGGSGWLEIDTVAHGVSTYEDSGLTENTSYYYRIRAFKL